MKTQKEWMDKLRTLTINCDKTVEKASEGLSRTTVSAVRTGKKNDLLFSTLMAICENCGSSIEEFFGGEQFNESLPRFEMSLLTLFRELAPDEQGALLNYLRVRVKN